MVARIEKTIPATTASTHHRRRLAMAIIAIRIHTMLLMAVDASGHVEHAKRALRRPSRLFHRTVTLSTRQVGDGNMTPVREEDVGRHLRQLGPLQFLACRGDGANTFFFRT